MQPQLPLPGPKAEAIINRDQKVISPSYPRYYPFVMDHGKGSYVWDVDGNQFLDFAAGIAVTSTGHSHPKVVKAIQDQAEKFIHISSDYYHEPWVALGEQLNEIAPFKNEAMSFMTNSGTESVEAAIKLARHFTGRSQFIGFLGSFHGRTMGSLAFTASNPRYKENFFPMVNGVTHVPFPDPYHPILTSLPGEYYGETVVRYIEEQILNQVLPPSEVAGILVETIQGEGGYVFPAPGFYESLRALCDRYGILLIVDEVQCGMGRTGQWWAIQHYYVEPDIVCVGKGIASGMPLGAIIAKEELMTWTKGAHGNTYGGNPIACAAALATIDLIKDQYMANAAQVGQYALEKLQSIALRYPSIGQVRGMGLMIGVEFVQDQETRRPDRGLRDKVVLEAFQSGLLLLGCGKSTIRIAPPLNISRDEIDQGLSIFEHVLSLAGQQSMISNVA
ncbi:MAG: acetyl ornithine aminotransferase family protein [Anaerolineales bacterium]